MAALLYASLVLCLYLLHRFATWRRTKAEDNFAKVAPQSEILMLANRPQSGDVFLERLRKEERARKALLTSDHAEALSIKWIARCDRLGAVREWMRTTRFAKAISYFAGLCDFTGLTLWMVERSLGVGPGSVGEWAVEHLRSVAGF